MNINELLHKRVLVAAKQGYGNKAQTVEELKVLEVSPSGDWVKVQNMTGQKFWKHHSDFTPIEVLAFVEKAPAS